MGSMVRKKICAGVKESGLYSILVDESSKREQMAIVLRYMDVKTGAVLKRFLTYVEVVSLDAQGLSQYILDTLNHFGLDPPCIVSQGYSGASVISGKLTRVQWRIKEVAPQAEYVHCYAHCLNLALVDITKSIPEASDFFALMVCFYLCRETKRTPSF